MSELMAGSCIYDRLRIGLFNQAHPARMSHAHLQQHARVISDLHGTNLPGARDQLSPTQVEAVISQYFTRPGAPSVNLHNTKVAFPDGAKGFTEYRLAEDGWGGFEPYANFRDKGLHARYCASDAVILAMHLSSTSYLSKAKDTLITVSDFAVIDVIKGDATGMARVGNTIEVVRLGGEVTDEGEKLQFTVSERPDYSAGNEYLLFLKGKPSTRFMPFKADDFATVQVLNHRVYPSEKAWAGLGRGDNYDDVSDRIHWLSATFQCRR